MHQLCINFRADTQPQTNHYSPLRHHKKHTGSSEQVCNKDGISGKKQL